MVKIEGGSVTVGSTTFGAQMAPLRNLKLNKAGVIKEFPDLEDSPDWREEAVSRFEMHIRKYRTEMAKAKYIIADLRKHGYVPKRLQEQGKRWVKINGGTS